MTRAVKKRFHRIIQEKNDFFMHRLQEYAGEVACMRGGLSAAVAGPTWSTTTNQTTTAKPVPERTEDKQASSLPWCCDIFFSAIAYCLSFLEGLRLFTPRRINILTGPESKQQHLLITIYHNRNHGETQQHNVSSKTHRTSTSTPITHESQTGTQREPVDKRQQRGTMGHDIWDTVDKE